MYLLQENGELVEMTEHAYDSEVLLQELLARYPSLLAGEQIDPATPRRWLLIRREVGVPSEDSGGDRWAVGDGRRAVNLDVLDAVQWK
jgi:hypothetical protein